MAKPKASNKMSHSQIAKKMSQPEEAAVDDVDTSASEEVTQVEITSWRDSLTPEERAVEERKQKAREMKAAEMKQQQELNRTRRANEERQRKQAELKEARQEAKYSKVRQQERQRAAAEGMLEAQEHSDGLWYVSLGSGTWREVDQQFWCRHCEAGMSEAAVISHLNGDRHRRKTAGLGLGSPSTSTSTSPTAHCSPCMSSTGGNVRSGSLWSQHNWQEVLADGQVRCIPCQKFCDGIHETTAEHAKRVFAYIETLKGDYKEPEVPWLVWASCEEWGEGLYLKCLLCNKWIQDLVGTDARGYDGNHGSAGSQNQKDHAKKIRNLPHVLAEYAQDRDYWDERRAACGVLAATPAAAPATPAAAPASSSQQPQQPAAPELPEGWYAAWSEEDQAYFFYTADQTAQWEVPLEPAI